MGTLATYKPLYVWCSPASIPQIVAHIQDYLVKNPIVSTETVAEIVVQSLQEHPELINGDVIPITEDSAQTIKEYIDALPSLDGYTKAETDALLLLKQNLLTWDQTPTAGSSNPVTSEGIKAAISASAAALADLISTKADIASVYTKATTDALLLQKADAATTYSKNAVDALLDTKVDINDTYTRADIDLMKQVDKANTAIVSAADGTAPLNIAAGQYVYLGDILYMATEPIPEGDPLVPGTNIALNPKGVTNVIGDGLQNLAGVVSTQSDQIAEKANQSTLAPTCNDATAPAGGIPANFFFYHNGELYYTPTQIAQGSEISATLKVDNGGLNKIVKAETGTLSNVLSGLVAGVLRIEKKNKIVSLCGYFYTTSQITIEKNTTLLFKMPWKPKERTMVMIYNSGNSNTGTFLFTGVIETNGGFYMDQPGTPKTLSANTYMTFASPVIYFTND